MLGLHLITVETRCFPAAFRSAAGWRQFLAAYQTTLAGWSPPARPRVVGTRFGRTRLQECGPADAPPLILLHGFASTSTMWAPTVAALGRRFHIWAPDTLGDVGLSEPARWPRGRADYVLWLTDVLAELGVARARFVGFSYGAWLALALAATQPTCVEQLALLDAAGFVPVHGPVMLAAAAVSLSHSRRLIEAVGRAFHTDYHPRTVYDEQFLCGLEHFRRRGWVLPAPLRDGELRGLASPVLALWGAADPTMDTRQALARAQRLVPQLEADLLAGAGHGVYLEADRVNPRLLTFLSDGQG